MKKCPYLLHLILSVICVSFLTTFLFPYISSAETGESWVAKVVSVQGSVEVRKVGESQWQKVKLNDTYCPGDVIRVNERSRAEIALINHPIIRLDQNSTIVLGGLKEDRTSLIDLLKGAAHFFSRFPRMLEVHTAFVNAGVEGTEFFIRVEEDKTSLSIFEGKVLASNEFGTLTLISGQSALAESGKAPVSSVVVSPRDAVQWALYYPQVVYFSPKEFQVTSKIDWLEMVRRSIEFYMRGDLEKAFDSIKEVAEEIDDPRFFTWRASLLLAVGRLDEANIDIEHALNLNPKYSDAFALQAIIAVVQNEKDKALRFSKEAVNLNPNSAAAHIAHSYAKQSSFDLEGALTSLKEAVKHEPNNALAWARLAEIQLSFCELGRAQEAAQKAVALCPNLSRTQTVLGFVYLTQLKTSKSSVAFKKAIEFDQADPLPRLGLGLVKIRDGYLDGGRREIEIAVSLNPDNSIFRSYLGKAYFEEKQDKQSSGQFILAKEFDPSDPTHFFYNAIRKQTLNRPVEALHDLQKAIELNDNRAVYRSRLLLDSDLASRNASLARIYSDMGFEQLALAEGWKSVNTDPTNFSAHRFLADSYSILPRHKIARVSELLQSQLLQPINITPIQPYLAESNLLLISREGPVVSSFNEFNPLFNRDNFAFQANRIVGKNSTNGAEIVLSGIYKKASCSFGGFQFETDGFRENNDQEDDIYNAFVQIELTYKTSIQAEYRYRNTKHGDLELKYFLDDPNIFSPNKREERMARCFRFGIRHAVSPSSMMLGSFIYQNKDLSYKDNITGDNLFYVEKKDDAMSGELQYLFRSKFISITSGVGYFDIDGNDVMTTEIILPPPIGCLTNSQVVNNDTKHTNLYIYSNINLLKNAIFTIGGSYDFFDCNNPDYEDRDQFNPKFGITWNPVSKTTLRAAVFRVLKRTLITDQTLESTQIAGFNQFFDDPDSTDAWHYGGAIDQKFSQNIYGGVEFFQRKLNVFTMMVDPNTLGGPPDEKPVNVSHRFNWKENLSHVYLFWTPYKWLACSTEYQYEKFKRDEECSAGIKELTTHQIPLAINIFHTLGLSVSLKGTYFNQEGDFHEEASTPGIYLFKHGKDNFWVFDVAISYRLSRRYGFITVGAKNLFDKNFNYWETDVNNPIIQPDRSFFCRITLAF